MSRSLVSVKQATISAGGYLLPVIHAVLDIDSESGGPTDYEIYQQIYEASIGFQSICCYYNGGGYVPPAISLIPLGRHTYTGDLDLYVDRSRDFEVYQINIDYSGRMVSRAYAFTGYGTYETPLLVIFTNRDNWCFNEFDEFSLYLTSSAPLSYSNIGGIVCSSVVTENCSIHTSSSVPNSPEVWLDLNPYLVDQSDDPYAPGGIAEPGGGDGTFDWESDIVPVQPLPAISITDAGFVNLYVPTKAQLQNLCRYLWSSAFDIDSLKRIFLEPMDVIIGLSILPITPEEVDADLGTILVGQYSSGISSYVAHKQYVQVDCGTVTIEPKWGAYLDFSPYSKLQLYLPYIGFVDITPDDCMNGTIRVVYNLDILSGACLAQIECTTPGKDGELNSHVLYEYTGNCSVECPVTSGQYRNIISSMFNIASGVVETAATGNPTPILNSVIDTVKGITKPTVSRAGGPGKNTGILGHQAPFLVLTCPRMIIPGQQNAMIGYPSYVTLNLGDLNGYTQVDTIHLFGVPASKDEQDEIIDLLQKGVFL